ncbi:9b9f262d-e417-41ca-991e-9fbc54897877 [Thermothielavioides terrestris]|uniref:non-specific serine/threonine protein kinase n=1 Tax=Thermothielavioides terrestris TaxID=2587410 RepID=A0A446BX43_9PEZI|nr:9b9f262d-e417-41ca-991e-9fbc54897877 [Thermothielavioides terrestris]
MAESLGPRPSQYYRHTNFMDEHVENVERYKPGGYHPVDIGDTITNGEDTYTVLHKLGHGGFSTVWLAKRQREHSAGSSPSFHALKILRADLSDELAGHEHRFLQRLGQAGSSTHPNIVMLEDSFTVSGPNGQHRCLVFPFLGPSLYSLLLRERIVAATSFPGLDPASLTSVQIIDFGCAFANSAPPATLGCPLEYFPPELIFDDPASTHSDVWQLAAIIFYVCTDSYMFQVGFQIPFLLVAFIVQYHGPLPSRWRGKFVWSKYARRQPSGEPAKPLPEPDWWFDGSESTKSLKDRIGKDMVVLEPDQRISAAEASRRLESEVFVSVSSG